MVAFWKMTSKAKPRSVWCKKETEFLVLHITNSTCPSSSTAKSSELLSEELSSYSESWLSPGSLDVGVPSLPSSFENSGCSTLSTCANSSHSVWWTAVWYMFRGRVYVPALYLVVSCQTVHCLMHWQCVFAQILIRSWSAELTTGRLCCIILGKSWRWICVEGTG